MRIYACLACLSLLVPAVPAAARDERLLYSIEGALGSEEGKDRFDQTIRFFWAGEPHAQPQQRFGIYTAENKVSTVTRTDREACERAFLDALASLRDSARALGANAIVDIKSLHENREFVSDSQYECRAGYLVTSVALEGRVVDLPERTGARGDGEAEASAIETTPIQPPRR